MSDDQKLVEWQCPNQAYSEQRRLRWLDEATEEGQIWLRAQRGFEDFHKAMDVLSGRTDFPDLTDYRSHFNTNRLKRNVREVVGALADIRPIWGYRSENPAYAANAEMMNKVSKAVYLEGCHDMAIKEALQYSAATCAGWVKPCYRRSQGGKGTGKITLLSYGSPCVLPTQLPSSGDFQEAYAVTLLDEMPIYMAHSYWPDFQDRLHPTQSKYWYDSEIRKAAQGNIWRRMFNGVSRKQGEQSRTNLFIPIRYTTIIDNSINTTGEMIPMGEPGTSWYYEVPPVGGMVFAGYDRHGQKVYRKATVDDARLFPQRRLVISSENCIMYDGPAFNWHGMLDLIPFTVDKWPWEAIGFSLIRDGFDIQENINQLERGSMDKYRAQLDMPLGYDINSVTRREALQFDPMQPRARVGFDGSMVDKPFAPCVPPEVYELSAEVAAAIKHYEETMDYQMALKDIVALAKARALSGKADLAEAMLESQGPIVKDISRGMEKPLTLLGDQIKYLILQYMPTKRIMEYVGEDGVTSEVFDYDPAQVIPSHLPTEISTDTVTGSPVRSNYSDRERAKWFADNLRFTILPHSAHQNIQMEHRLMLLQMRQRQIPVDSRTIAEACDIPNYGTKPEGNTVWDRYWNEQEEMIMHALKVQKLAQDFGLDLGLMAPGLAQAPTGGGSSKGKGGRPPSGQKAPQQVSKGDGRPVIKES